MVTAEEKITVYETKELKETYYKIGIPIISILIAFIFSSLALIALNEDPVTAFSTMILSLFKVKTIADILFYSTPLIFTGLAVAVGFRGGMFNIGVEGQLYFGAFCTALVGAALPNFYGIHLPSFLFIPLLITVGAIGGALWAIVPAILKSRGVHEVITTIMMNYIALTLMVFFVGDLSSPFTDKQYGSGNVSPQTELVGQEGWLAPIFGKTFSSLHYGFLVSILATIVIYIILWRTRFGYETRAVGHNPNAAKYGGINVNRNLIYVMLLSGALGGLAGSIEVLGFWHRFLNKFSPGYGFDGIAVALLGGNHPFGVIFGAVVFGWLKSGGEILQLEGIPKDIAETFKGFIVFFIAIPLLSKTIIRFFNNSVYGDYWKTEIRRFYDAFNKNKYNYLRNTLTFLGLIAILMTYSSITTYFTDERTILLINLLFVIIITSLYVLLKRIRWRIPNLAGIFILGFAIFVGATFLGIGDLFGDDIGLFSLIATVILFIGYFEIRSREKLPQLDLEEEETVYKISDKDRRKLILFYGSFIVVTIAIFLIGIIMGETPFIIEQNLFVFTLRYWSQFFAMLGLFLYLGFMIFLIVQNIFDLKILPAVTDDGVIFRLSSIFKLVVFMFIFMAIPTLFNMSPSLLFTQTLGIATSIGLAALGGFFSEKSGVVNIGLEGKMLTGAFVSVWITSVTNDPWLGVVGAIISGGLMGLLHAIASLKYRADQVVVGVAINILATALTTLGLIVVWNLRGTSDPVQALPNVKLPFINEIPVIGEYLYEFAGGNSGMSPIIYLFVLLIFVSSWVIQKTSFGLRVRSVGEHPKAADTLGINVINTRYICVILSGMLAALGGAHLTLGTAPVFGKGMTTGRGFVALAALIFGGWTAIGAAAASLLFGFAFAFRFQLEILGFDWIIFDLHFRRLTPTIPYLITIIAVAVVAKRMKAPAADGIPYEKEK